MSANHYESNNNTIPYRKKLSKKEQSLHNVSAEFNKLTNIIYTNTNYTNVNPNQIKIINLSNNNNRKTPGKNLIFKNIKLYGVKKHSNYNKKRNNSNKNINNIPCVSSTEINTNLKKTYSNLNLNNIHNNNFLTKLNSNMNLYSKTNNSNSNTKINKSLPKSKSNSIFLTPFQKYNIHSRNRNINNILIKSNSNSGDARSYNNSHNKKLLNRKMNKCHTNYNYNTLYINTVSKSSQKIKQINKAKPKGSSEENKIMIKKLMKELENKENEIKLKNKIIKEKENKIILLKQNEIEMKEKLKKITNKYDDINELYQNMMNQNKLLKEKIIENEKNINFLKEKELKLMRILYLIKEKGIDINSVLNEVKKESYAINSCDANNESNLTNSSNLTIYFPDKINMRNIMETKGAQKIPRIDINQIPEYSFQSEEDKQNDDEMPNQYNFMQNNIGFNNYGLHGFQNSV